METIELTRIELTLLIVFILVVGILLGIAIEAESDDMQQYNQCMKAEHFVAQGQGFSCMPVEYVHNSDPQKSGGQ